MISAAGRGHTYLTNRPDTGIALATFAVGSCTPTPLTSRSAATISSSTADTIIARKSLCIQIKPLGPGSVPALRHVAVDARVGRGGSAAELSQFGNNVVRIHQYPPAPRPPRFQHPLPE